MPGIETISEEVCCFLRKNIIAEGVSFDENSSLSSLGIDSFSIIEILLFIERRYNIVVPESDLTPDNLRSVASLTRCIHSKSLGD
ncbi:MAG: acyl carrier protein [Nitrospirae bacterium]|nr:acyl carrier protein [Nitrospirota bacterium]